MRDLKLSMEMAVKWYKGQDAELKELAVQTYPELEFKQLPKTWEELGNIDGYYVKGMSSTIGKYHAITEPFDKNIFATKEQAEASIAMAQLSQLMKVYNDGWVPNWSDDNPKRIIVFNDDEIITDWSIRYRHFLAFETGEIRDKFLENFKDLILTSKPLL